MKLKKMNRKTRKMRAAIPATISQTMFQSIVFDPPLPDAVVGVAFWANRQREAIQVTAGYL
jgi:hypothetical protein